MPRTTRSGNRRPARIYLREWLTHRGLTAEQLADRVDTSKSVISKLETGSQRYNQDWLERIAFALDCDVPDLYRPPRLPEQQRQIDDFTRFILDQSDPNNR